jgi:hypothetical protein
MSQEPPRRDTSPAPEVRLCPCAGVAFLHPPERAISHVLVNDSVGPIPHCVIFRCAQGRSEKISLILLPADAVISCNKKSSDPAPGGAHRGHAVEHTKTVATRTRRHVSRGSLAPDTQTAGGVPLECAEGHRGRTGSFHGASAARHDASAAPHDASAAPHDASAALHATLARFHAAPARFHAAPARFHAAPAALHAAFARLHAAFARLRDALAGL